MEKKVLAVCIMAATLGLLSTALGLAAESKRIKHSQVIVNVGDTHNVCIYPGSPAFGLGFFSAISLLGALFIISVASGCFCCCRRWSHPSNPRCECNVALVCFIFSWITFVPAFLLTLSAASLNNQQSMNRMYFSTYCYVVKSGVFAGAASLSFISVTLGILYYLIFTSGKSGVGGPLPSNGIAMGQPQVPPTTEQPAFVHEDTYMRRQFA